MAKYYSVPSLYERNVYLQRKIKALKEMNAALKREVAQLVNSRNQDPAQMLPQPSQQQTDVYLYFSYKQQIKQKLQEIKELEEKCSKIFYQSIIRKSDKQAVDSDEQIIEPNKTESVVGEKGIMKNLSFRKEQDENQNEQQINGRKMSKKQLLLQKKESKKSQQQSKNTIPEIQILQQMMNEQKQPQKSMVQSQQNYKIGNNQGNQGINKQKLLPPLQFLKKYIPEDEISHRYKSDLHNRRQLQEGKCRQDKNILRLINRPFDMKEFVKYDWSKIQHLGLNNCQLTTEDWNIFCGNHALFKNLKGLVLLSNQITEVRGHQIEKFHNLVLLNFGDGSHQRPNPLSKQSIQDLKRWQRTTKSPPIYLLYSSFNGLNSQANEANLQSNQQKVQPPVKVLKQTSCIEYLKGKYPYKENLLGSHYGPISDKSKATQLKTKGIKHSQNSFYLIHNYKKPTIQDFFKLNWQEFEQMRFCDSKFNDEDWKNFTANAKQYPNLKLLLLNNNKIQQVRFEELQMLKEIKYLNLKGNKLSERSICEIEEYKQKHKDVKVLYD